MPHPARLDDPQWMTDRYASASSETIARDLGVAATTVRRALLRHGIDVRDRSAGQMFRAAPQLHDAGWLRQRYSAGRSGAEIAAELGVSVAAVHHAFDRPGIDCDGAWVRSGHSAAQLAVEAEAGAAVGRSRHDQGRRCCARRCADDCGGVAGGRQDLPA